MSTYLQLLIFHASIVVFFVFLNLRWKTGYRVASIEFKIGKIVVTVEPRRFFAHCADGFITTLVWKYLFPLGT